MPESKSTRAPQDASHINLSKHHEVGYWTKKFGVSESELEAAVMAVGSGAEAVEAFLKKK